MQLSAQPVLVSPIGPLDCLQYSTDEGQCGPVASLRHCASLDKDGQTDGCFARTGMANAPGKIEDG